MTDKLLEKEDSAESQKNKLLEMKKSASDSLKGSFKESLIQTGMTIDTSSNAGISDSLSKLNAPGVQLTMREYNLLKNFQSNLKYQSHDEIIERIGGSGGKFQIFSYIMCLILFSTEAFLIYNLAFLNLVPYY